MKANQKAPMVPIHLLWSSPSNSNTLLEVNYNYKYYGNKTSGKGFLVNANQSKISLIENEHLVEINDDKNTIIEILDFKPLSHKSFYF